MLAGPVRRRLARGALLALAVLSVLAAGPRPGEATGGDGIVPEPLRLKVQAAGTGRVLVELRLPGGPHVPEGDLQSPAAVTMQRDDIAAVQLQLLGRLAGKGHRLVHKYQTVPLLALEVDAAGLAELEAAGLQVARVVEDELVAPLLTQSVPLVEATQAASRGFDGTGTVIAVLDTGVDAAHPFLAGKVVEEACYSSTGVSLCPGGQAQQEGPGAARPCAAGCEHGTHVAGIAAGNGLGATTPPTGVARGAHLIAIQVFHRAEAPADCSPGPAPCVRASYSDIIAGLERVYALRSRYTVAAANLSLGGGLTTKTCDTEIAGLKPIIDNLRSARIATVIAAGNDGSTREIAKPACISSAVSVGATTKADAVSSFSNVAAILSLLAPGTSITSSIPGRSFAAFDGTSMAAPHVAGAWAILRQAAPDASVTEILTALEETGQPVTDLRPGGALTKPRIRIAAALNRFVAQTFALGVVRAGTGTGSVTSSAGGIACGAVCSASYSLGTTVTLTASPAPGSVFAGWSGGGCGGTAPCTVTMTAATSVTATFATSTTFVLAVLRTGAGAGAVSSAPAGIACGSTCSALFAGGSVVTLTATPELGSLFAGWNGDCAGTALTCTVTLSQARGVTATFAPGGGAAHTLTITGGPAGSPNPAAPGVAVSLSVTAVDSLGHFLAYAWTATCPALGGGGALSDASAAAPTWLPPPNSTGAEQGCIIGVTVSDGQGLSQSASYVQRVSPTQSTVTVFQDGMENGAVGWSPQPPWGLTAAAAHSGARAWTDSPNGNYANNVNASLYSPPLNLSGYSSATLTFWHRYDLEDGFDFGTVWATTDSGSTFTRLGSFTGLHPDWTPASLDLSALAGQPRVQIVFQVFSDGAVTRDGWLIDDVAVTGVRSGVVLTVVTAGTGTGTVTSDPAGIACGATCSASFPAGSTVTLTAAAAVGSAFTGWSGGGCAGTGPCTVALAAAVTVTATFSAGGLPGDDRASPVVIAGESFSDSRPTQGYTSAADDPVHSCTGLADGHSLWYRFTPTRAGAATIRTAGSDYDTVLSVHAAATGAEVAGGCNDDVSLADRSSTVIVKLDADTPYLIEVSAYAASPAGTLALSLAFTAESLPGDDRTRPIVIATDTFADTRPTDGYTVAADDPVHSCTGAQDGRTVWYRFVPGRAGTATLTTAGSDYDTVLAVHRESTLAEVGCSDDLGPEDRTSFLQVPLAADTPYLIGVSAYGASSAGTLIFSWSFGAPVTDRVSEFVLAFYQQVLQRTPAASEVAAWAEFLRANPTPSAASLMAHGFLDGAEYLAMPVTPAAHVTLLYRVFLGRSPDAPGLAGWVRSLLDGLDTALPSFVGSPEFRALLPDTRSRPAVESVVRRLYVQVLARDPSAADVAGWADYIVATGDVLGAARGFFDAPEYVGTPRTLAQHVGVLYRTFLGRDPATAEVTPWVEYLEGFRVSLEDSFIGSPEFQGYFRRLFE